MEEGLNEGTAFGRLGEEGQVPEWLEARWRNVDGGALGQEVPESPIDGSNLCDYTMEENRFDEEWAAMAMEMCEDLLSMRNQGEPLHGRKTSW